MNVSELIGELEKYDKDTAVVIMTDDFYGFCDEVAYVIAEKHDPEWAEHKLGAVRLEAV